MSGVRLISMPDTNTTLTFVATFNYECLRVNVVSVLCSFELRLRISLSAGKLILIPRVRNTDNKPFSFAFSLCNYLSVSDIRYALMTKMNVI